MNRGRTKSVTCSNCNRQVQKDKCIKKFTVRDIIDGSSKEDIKSVQVYENFIIPKVYNKLTYCISCAIHARIVRARSAEARRIRVVKRVVGVQKDKEDDKDKEKA